jgi:vitamin K-dependent gamma-carboxylase-like protein
LLWFAPPLNYHINLASKNSHFIDPQPIIRVIAALGPREVLFSPTAFTALYWITTVAGVTALVGLCTRVSIFIVALGVWIFVSHAYSYADVHHPQAVFAIFLMVLPFAPVGDRLSVDALIRRWRARRGARVRQTPETLDTAMWPLKLLHVLLALTYFSTGITKLISGGLAWMNGYTLQNYIFSDAMTNNLPLGIWLAQQYTLCVVLAVLTILFEVFYFVSILVPRVAPFFFIGGIFFHIGLYATSGHPFFEHMVMNALLLLFLDPDWFPEQVRKLEALIARWRAGAEVHQPS